jgi:hypothetical protein
MKRRKFVMNDFFNPYIFSRAVRPDEFIGRKNELRRLVSRIATGQSTAVVGQPHVGKTSILNYILDETTRVENFGDRFDNCVFSYLDAHMLRSVKAQATFWEYALAPLKQFIETNAGKNLEAAAAAFAVAEENQYQTFVIERMLNALENGNVRLILFIDEFDDLLSHPVLNSAEFYGGLRSLASRVPSFVLLIASRRDLSLLNSLTQEINPHSSPYFNVFTELHLGAFSTSSMNALMQLAGDNFTKNDRDFIRKISGGHPYLSQVAAAMLFDAHLEGKTDVMRYKVAGRSMYQQAKGHFLDTWRVWSNESRKAVTAVALSQIPKLVSGHRFSIQDLIEDLDDFSPELFALEGIGVVVQDDEGGWEITQDAFLWWLADEIRRSVRETEDFNSWLHAQELDGLFTKSERKKVGEAAKVVSSVLGKGATTLIESMAGAFGSALGSGLT